VGDPSSELSLGGEVLGQMNRIAIAGELRKATTSEEDMVFESVSAIPTERSSK
jgi:hypothetical protein